MSTLVQKGEVLDWYNDTGSEVANDALVKIGNRCGVAQTAIASLATGAVAMVGVHKLGKGTGVGLAWGDDVFLDEDDGKVTRFAAGAAAYVGKVVEAAGTAATTVKVRLEDPGPAVGEGGNVEFFDDFLGYALDTAKWQVVDVGAATEALLANTHGGVARLHIHATDEAEDAVFYAGDQLQFDIGKLQTFECKLTVTTGPGTGVTAVWGMASAHNLDKDAVAEAAWFRLQATLDLLLESDDGTHEKNDQDTTIDLVAGEAHLFKIDFGDTSDVKFYVDGIRQLAAVTFDMSDFTGVMQLYFSLDKASGTGLGDLDIDWVRLVASR